MSADRLMPPGGASPPLDGKTPVFEEMGTDPRVAPGADRPPGSIAKIGTLYLEKCDLPATCWRPIICDVVLDMGVSTGGNTLGQTGLVDGSIVLAGVSGITLSQATNASGATISIIGQTGTATSVPLALRAGSQQITGGTAVFSNSNGITFGMSNSSVVTAAYSQSTAPAGLAAGTETATSGTVVFSNSNNLTFGLSGSVLTASASYSQSTAPGGLAAGTQTATSGTVVFSNSNNLTFGLSGSVLTASASFPAQTTQPAVNVAGGTQTATSGTVVFANSNGVTFGLSGSSQMTASVSREPSLAAGTQTASSGTVVFSNSNNVSFGLSGSSVVTASASFPAQTTQPAINAAAGTQTATSGTVVFANSNNITFGMSGSSQITASIDVGSPVRSVGAQDFGGGAGINVDVPRWVWASSVGFNVAFSKSVNGVSGSIIAHAQAAAIADGANTATSGTVVFANSNNVTFGLSGSSQMTASVGTVTVSAFENFAAADMNGTTLGDIQLFLQRLQVPLNISATRAAMIINISNSSSAGGSMTIRFGAYTMSGSTASLASSASRTLGYNSTAATSYTSVSGWRYHSISLGTWNLTPGDYLFGAVVSISTSGTSGTYSWKARRNLPLDGQEFNNAASTYPYFFHGSYTTITGGLPNSIQVSQIAQVGGGTAADENDSPWWALFGTI